MAPALKGKQGLEVGATSLANPFPRCGLTVQPPAGRRACAGSVALAGVESEAKGIGSAMTLLCVGTSGATSLRHNPPGGAVEFPFVHSGIGEIGRDADELPGGRHPARRDDTARHDAPT